jgi:hypothetical protein
MEYYSADENRQIPPQPPYNATNFTPANQVIYNMMVNNAKTQPNYPLNQGSDSDQINRQMQNVSYFTSMQQQTQNGTKPFPAFRLDQRRLMYIQGQYATASRNIITKENTSGPAGVPFFTLPSAPTLVSAIQGFYGIVVTFTGPEFTFTSPNQACESKIISYQARLSNSTTNVTTIVNNIYSSPYTIAVSSETSYQLAIAAINAGGVGLFSNPLISYVIPSPTEFQVIPTGASGTVTLYFNEAITEFNTGIYTIFQYYIAAVKNSDQTVQQYFYTPTDNTATSYVYTITNLTNGVDYTFYIFARINPSNPQSGYAVQYGPTVTPYGPPLAPIIQSVTVEPGTDFIVVFQQPINGVNDGNNQITGYTIVVTHTNTGISYSHPVSAVTDSGEVVLTYSTSFEGGLVLNVITPFTMVIFATNAAGSTSSAPYSGTVTKTTSQGGRVPVITPPSSPILTLQTGINTVYFNFIQGSTGNGTPVSYQYSKNGVYTSFTPTNTGFSYYFKLTNVAAGTYTFAVKATNNRGFNVSNNVTVTVRSVTTLLPITQRLRLLLRR